MFIALEQCHRSRTLRDKKLKIIVIQYDDTLTNSGKSPNKSTPNRPYASCSDCKSQLCIPRATNYILNITLCIHQANPNSQDKLKPTNLYFSFYITRVI